MRSLIFLTIVSTSALMGQVPFQVNYDLSSEWEATGFNNGRSMVRDADGYYHVVYHSQEDPNSPPGGPCDIYYSHTLVPAPPASPADWSPAVCIASLPYDDRYPSIAIEHGSSVTPGDDDTLHVVWQHNDYEGGPYDIWHVSCPNRLVPPPDAWGAPMPVWMSPYNSLVPDIDCSFMNIIHVVWQEENFEGSPFSEILYLRSLDHGLTWTNWANISQTPATNSQMPDVATVIDFPGAPSYYAYASNTVHVAWNDDLATTPPNIFYTNSPDAGSTWNPWTNVSVASGSNEYDGYPSMTVSINDIPHVVWMHGVLPGDPDTPGPYLPGADPTISNCFPGPIAGMYSGLYQVIHYSDLYPGAWRPFEVVSIGVAADDHEFPSIACDLSDMLWCSWQAWHDYDYDVFQAQRPAPVTPWTGYLDISSDMNHDDLFPSEATKKAGLYTPGYDLVWTKIDGDLSAGGHGPPAALSPAHGIWFCGISSYNYVPVYQEEEEPELQGFWVKNNPVVSGTWINTGATGGRVMIFDLAGRTVLQQDVSPAEGGLYWNVSSGLPAGTYSVLLDDGGSTHSTKVVVLGR